MKLGEEREGYPLMQWSDSRLHKWILQDKVRNEAFKRAIEEIVKPDDVVLDLGSGTGYLSFLAAQAGAGKIYGIEYHQNLVDEAKKKAKELGLEDRVHFIHGYSLGLDRNSIEPVDVIVSETLGFMGIGEGIVTYVSDARRKWLKPDGKIIPQNIELYLVPVFHPGYDKRSIKQIMCNVKPEYPKAEAVKIADFDLSKDNEVKINEEINFKLRKTKINGFAGWFSSRLSPNVVLDTSPFSTQTCWHQMFYPLGTIRGSTLTVRISSYAEKDLTLLKVENCNPCQP